MGCSQDFKAEMAAAEEEERAEMLKAEAAEAALAVARRELDQVRPSPSASCPAPRSVSDLTPDRRGCPGMTVNPDREGRCQEIITVQALTLAMHTCVRRKPKLSLLRLV